ncbi:branched-chain-amino-acid transaminase [Venenivibrio stagnispumantis]|uniref:Branched-chain-amino-acid aminotransferase n=1 Tax=Venenivibrio stagnispumantis TaxID=407998 RepID=A0AA45WL89_9AQUI|nr:branched-chain amino acid transaminase [Venenivibrio stagnispumantis]MCW4573698.1 branched-chain amino acid transaminase [Venenivibrio stagnispumantis]SMP10021.1 branched-chain amino acid aminotransferase [Venenivibrio stagnispumantis]
MSFVYFEGKIVHEDEAKISIKTNSFHYGTAVFEGIRAYYNKENDTMYGLFFKEHYQRLFTNMKILNMSIDETIDELVEITKDLIKKNNYKEDVYIRPIVYFADLKISPKLIGYTARIAIYTLPLGDYIDTSKGIKAKISSWTRLNDNMIPPRLKVTGAYVNSAFAKTEALLAGADEAIVLNKNGYVSEGSAENIFIVRDGTLITPPVSDDILEGITRKAIIQIAKDNNIPVVERNIARTELYVADEVFFCGTGAQISPVVIIDDRVIGDGSPGKITKFIQNIYFDAVRGKIEKYKNWVVEIK